jgi:hypothetical protein
MTPWLVLTAFVAALNLLAFVWIRGRWGRIVVVLAAASVVGTITGNAIAQAIGLELLRLGEFDVLGASVVAQLAMLAVVLLAALGPRRIEIE